MTPPPDRLRALARQQAYRNHQGRWDSERWDWVELPHGAPGNSFEICSHPDCVLVREAPSQEHPSTETMLKRAALADQLFVQRHEDNCQPRTPQEQTHVEGNSRSSDIASGGGAILGGAAAQVAPADSQTLETWRSWAQFVYLGGGPHTLTDAQLQLGVCNAHDKDMSDVRAELEAALAHEREQHRICADSLRITGERLRLLEAETAALRCPVESSQDTP